MNASRPRGFTLFELLLVMALLVVMTTLSWPAVEGMLRSSRLRIAADQVRADWGAARVESSMTGEIVMFRFELGGRQYRVEQWATGSGSTEGEEAAVGSSRSSKTHSELPEGVKFSESQKQAAADQRAQWATANATTASSGGAGWSAPILFYPDGTTSNGQIILQVEDDLYIAVRLRGLTGGSTMSGLFGQSELAGYLQP